MQATCFFLLLTSAGVMFVASPAAHAQQAVRVDTSGNPTTPLNLGGSNVTGLLAPTHLGTGTPSSATVLRGDGSWVGATATGNTIAATENLLQGDGSGNATAVATSADLQRSLQMRADTARALTALPANLLGNTNLVIRNGTVNADGTLTIPANDYIQWNAGDYGLKTGTLPQVLRYCYAVSTTDQPVGPAGFYLNAFYNGYNNVGFSNQVASQPEPGVSRYTFTNSVGNGGYTVYVTNATAAPLTIYPPVMTLTDAGLLPARSFEDSAVVPPQPVTDFDFARFASADRTSRYRAEQQTTLAADSVTGVNTNAGTPYAPRLTLSTQTVANGAVVGLYRGSVFRDSLPFAAFTLSHGISVQDLAFGSEKALPIVSALDPVSNGGIVNNNDGTYSIEWSAQSNVANDGYQNVYVVEVNTTTEAAMPVASRHRLIDVTSSAACVSTPGSAFVFPFGVSGSGGWLAQFHPSDSLAPGSGSYRYEVVSRYAPADWGAPNNLGDGAMSGLELVGSSWGYGSLGGPTGFVGDRLAILHCSTHNAVLGGGSLQRSVFYEEGAQSGNSGPSIMLAWYAANPAGTLSWNTNRCLFYANVGNRQANCLISHSGDGTNYGRGDISDCAFLGARWSDNSLHGTAIDYENVATGTINRVYVQAIDEIFGFNMPLSCEVEHSVFRQVRVARVGGSFHDNLVLAESASDPANLGNRAPGACLLQQNGASVTNNILWAHGLVSSLTNDDQAGGIALYPGVTTGTVQRNIIVLNPANTTVSSAYVGLPTGAPTGLSIDYNLVVNLTRGGFVTYGGTGNTSSWAAYQAAYPTLDAHSMYVDLSADPRGIQALFMDPINGDFRWAQTEVARRCAAFCRANNVGPATVTTHWPIVPSVDDAVRLLTTL